LIRAAELSAAHNLSANPASTGMSDVQVVPVSDLGQRDFRETAHQAQAPQHITFVVWNAGARTWVLTFATTTDTVPDDKVVQVARSITPKFPTGR
jgi:hypothetical protein